MNKTKNILAVLGNIALAANPFGLIVAAVREKIEFTETYISCQKQWRKMEKKLKFGAFK